MTSTTLERVNATLEYPATGVLNHDHKSHGFRTKLSESDIKAIQTYSRNQELIPVESDSDGEFVEHHGFAVLNKQTTLRTSSMTISCIDQNIKGSELIQIAHNVVRDLYEEGLSMCCEYEREIEGFLLDPPNSTNDILHIRGFKDWILSFGGWKGMMPSEEVHDYYFYEIDPLKRGQKFKGVDVCQNGLIFLIENHRIHLPEHFSINNNDITTSWKKIRGGYEEIFKTDLSYSQIVKAIQLIKDIFKLNDSQIALLQIFAFHNQNPNFTWFKAIPKINQNEIFQFLHYLNGLMFGIEVSGLNAALATGLMTLDLIMNNQITYGDAFKVNNDGGLYPYACFGNNKGTYNYREQVLLRRFPMSMKPLRSNPSLSPVGAKEAILIKQWLKFNNHILLDEKYKQIDIIKTEIEKLFRFEYFKGQLEEQAISTLCARVENL